MLRTAVVASFAIVLGVVLVRAADVTGQWTATFETQVGRQTYTFDFVVKGTALTGTIKGNLTGQSTIQDGKVDGDKIAFVENTSYEGMPLRIAYAGQRTSADEIKFTRTIADFGSEDLVAKRVK